MSRVARIMVIGATVAAAVSATAIRAQTQLEDPKNAARIFASTCSACHKSPQGLAKRGGTAAFLREHYTTGPEMSSAMAAYLASAGNGPPPREKAKESPAPVASKSNPKREHLTSAPSNEPGAEPREPRTTLRGKQRNAKAPITEPAPIPPERPSALSEPATAAPAAERPSTPAELPSAPTERASTPPASTTAALGASTPTAASPPSEQTPTLDLPPPAYPSEPPADLRQPSAFSSAPLP